MEITLKEYDHKGAAVATSQNNHAGEMTYSLAGESLIIIDHTEVEPEFGGKGVGTMMLNAIVEKARKEGKKILPLCPYAAAQFKKREEIQDVLK